MTANMWFRSYPEVSAIDYIIFGIVALLLPYGIYGYRRDQIRARVEEKFHDFLRDLAEYCKGGLSMTVAIQTLAKGEYGNLNDEVNKMASQISWGVSFGEVLEMFTERVTSPIVTRAVRMVDEANRAGGRISDILLAASYDAKEISQRSNFPSTHYSRIASMNNPRVIMSIHRDGDPTPCIHRISATPFLISCQTRTN